MSIRTLMVVSLFLGLSGCGDRHGPPAQAAASAKPGAPGANPAVRPDPTCSASLTAEQCAIARRSLERDGQQLADEAAQGPSVAEQKQAEARQNGALQAAQNKECAEQVAALEAIRRAQSPSPGEQISKEDLDALQVQRLKVERFVQDQCRQAPP
jgi:hypothetical protein